MHCSVLSLSHIHRLCISHTMQVLHSSHSTFYRGLHHILDYLESITIFFCRSLIQMMNISEESQRSRRAFSHPQPAGNTGQSAIAHEQSIKLRSFACTKFVFLKGRRKRWEGEEQLCICSILLSSKKY